MSTRCECVRMNLDSPERLAMDIVAIRQKIPTTKNVLYFNTGWSGPSPQSVLDAISQMLTFESAQGPTSRPVLDKHREAKAAARAAFASMVGASPEEIVLTENTTRGINIVLSGLTWQPGDEIVTDDLEHSSGLVPSYQLRNRYGVSVKIATLSPADNEASILEKLEEAISPRTRLLVLSHIMYSTGLRIPLGEVQRMAHRRGARVVVDAAQSLGQIPLDMAALESDYYAMPAHKWALGPDGVGALYVRKDLLRELVPTAVSGHAALSYDQAGQFEPALDSPEKFELTTSSAALLAGATAALEFLQTVGMEQIEARWQALAEHLRQTLSAIPGVLVTSPPAGPTACGLVTFVPGGWEPRALVDALWARQKIVARAVSYPPAARISVDFFNTEEELDCVVDTVRTLIKEGPLQ